MATETDAAPLVETAFASTSTDPTTAQPDPTQAADTTPTSPHDSHAPDQLDTAEAEFASFYANQAQPTDPPQDTDDDREDTTTAKLDDPDDLDALDDFEGFDDLDADADADPDAPDPAAAHPAPEASAPARAEDDGSLPGQLRPRLSDPEDIAIALLAKRNGWSLAKAAAARAAAQPAPADPSFHATQTNAATTPTAQPTATQDRSAASQRIADEAAALADEIEAAEARDDYLTPAHFKKVRRLAGLEADLKLARADEARESREAQAREQTRSDHARHDLYARQNATATQVRQEYPSISDPDSSLYAAASTVRAQMVAASDARLYGADAARVIIEAAAEHVATIRLKEQSIPRATTLAALRPRAAAPAPAVAPRSSNPAPVPPLRRVSPAPGSRSQAHGGEPATLGAAIAAAHTLKDSERLFDEAAASGLTLPGSRR